MDGELRELERARLQAPFDMELRERLRVARKRRFGYDPEDPISHVDLQDVSTTNSMTFTAVPGLGHALEEISQRPPQEWLITFSAMVRSLSQATRRRDTRQAMVALMRDGARGPEAAPMSQRIVDFNAPRTDPVDHPLPPMPVSLGGVVSTRHIQLHTSATMRSDRRIWVGWCVVGVGIVEMRDRSFLATPLNVPETS